MACLLLGCFFLQSRLPGTPAVFSPPVLPFVRATPLFFASGVWVAHFSFHSAFLHFLLAPPLMPFPPFRPHPDIRSLPLQVFFCVFCPDLPMPPSPTFFVSAAGYQHVCLFIGFSLLLSFPRLCFLSSRFRRLFSVPSLQSCSPARALVSSLTLLFPKLTVFCLPGNLSYVFCFN